MTRSRAALLIALGIDNFGTGLFLPLVLLYVTREIGLPLGVAGMAITGGGLVAFAVPPVAGHLVDWIGPRWVVITAFLVQATGVGLYLVADWIVTVVKVAMIVAVGQQLFYCALYVLVADVAGNVPRERPFALVAMVRTACFGAGAFAAVFVPSSYRTALVGDAFTFLAAAGVVAVFVHAPHKVARFERVPARVPKNRPYLALILFCGLFTLSLDFFLSRHARCSCSTGCVARAGCPARYWPCSRCRSACSAPSRSGTPAGSPESVRCGSAPRSSRCGRR